MEAEKTTSEKVFNALKTGVLTVARIVLGILIAIQINAWNGERKRVNFEKEILTQIRKNLKKDSIALAWYSKNAKNAIGNGKKILNLRPNESNDSIQYWLADVIYFDRFRSLTNGFEVLKSKGLGNVSNKQLVFLLGAYYDDKSIRITRGLEDIESIFTDEWIGIITKHVIDFEFSNYMQLDNYELFTKPGEARNLLKLSIENWRGSAVTVNSGLKSVQNMISMIDSEIKQ